MIRKGKRRWVILVSALRISILTLSLLTVGISAMAAAGTVSPLVVISGSMEPEITTGSLILARKAPAESLKVGDIASFSRDDGVLVTHRVTGNDPVSGAPDLRSVTMKGDANRVADAEPYVQSEALIPVITIPTVGSLLAAISNHKFELIATLSFGTGLYLAFRMILSTMSVKGRPAYRKSLDKEPKEDPDAQSH